MALIRNMDINDDIFDNIMEIENERQPSPCDKETAAQQQPPPRPKKTAAQQQPRLHLKETAHPRRSEPKLIVIRRDETGHHAVLEEPAPAEPTKEELLKRIKELEEMHHVGIKEEEIGAGAVVAVADVVVDVATAPAPRSITKTCIFTN
ncbi:hypothetical protein PUN28_000514 [Cardiocondyla obscurior]|uniref:Uncharacterized protein n=1 Tax=Cardiocondyla obscurior TaxID=286306 RepID=A0AAW2GZY9_9HYME